MAERLYFDGGLNENPDISLSECSEGQNFELGLNLRQFTPRKPQDLKDTTPNGASVNGILQLIKRDDSETTLVFENHSTPTIYEWDGSSFTSKRTAGLAADAELRDLYWSLDDYILITDIQKSVPILRWDGTDVTRQKTGLKSGSAQSVSSITRSGTTATVTTSSNHGYSTGDLVHIAGADQSDYNGEFEITVTAADEFTYEVSGSPSTPATGTITADFGTEVYARYGVVHQGRVWLFNVKTNDGSESQNPHMMVASKFEDPTVLDTASRAGDGGFSGNEAFYMLSPDLQPINGVVVFNKELVISTESGQLFRLTGSDSTNYSWVEYYQGSAAIGTEAIANIGNDVIFVRRGGNIETLRATDTSGDVATDDLSVWIPDTVANISDAKIVYDQYSQKVLFFVPDKVLVLHKTLLNSQKSPWSVYKTDMSNNFNTNAARYMRRPGEDVWTVYWGDDSGRIFDFNGIGSGDKGDTDIETFRETAPIYGIEAKRSILKGRVQYKRIGECELTVEADWSDEYNISDSSVTLSGPPASDTASFWGGEFYWGGSNYWNEGFEFADKRTTKGFDPTGRGRSFTLKLYLDTSVKFEIDHVDLGL